MVSAGCPTLLPSQEAFWNKPQGVIGEGVDLFYLPPSGPQMPKIPLISGERENR